MEYKNLALKIEPLKARKLTGFEKSARNSCTEKEKSIAYSVFPCFSNKARSKRVTIVLLSKGLYKSGLLRIDHSFQMGSILFAHILFGCC